MRLSGVYEYRHTIIMITLGLFFLMSHPAFAVNRQCYIEISQMNTYNPPDQICEGHERSGSFNFYWYSNRNGSCECKSCCWENLTRAIAACADDSTNGDTFYNGTYQACVDGAMDAARACDATRPVQCPSDNDLGDDDDDDEDDPIDNDDGSINDGRGGLGF